MSCFDRAFQMLCTMQPKRKRKCMLQDALRCTRRRRGREAGGVPLPSPWTKAPNCNSWLGHLAPVRSIAIDTGQRNHPWKKQTDALRPVRGKSSHRKALATSPARVVHCPPRPIPSRASWEKGDGKDLMSGAGTGRSSRQEGRGAALSLPPLLLSCSAGRNHSFPSSGWHWAGSRFGVFSLVCLFGFARGGAALEESQIPCAPS